MFGLNFPNSVTTLGSGLSKGWGEGNKLATSSEKGNAGLRHTESKSGIVYPEDKVTNRFTIFASIHDYVIISKIRYAYICKETNLLLSNDWNAKKRR